MNGIMNDGIKSRKFWLVVGIFLMSCLLLALGKVGEGNFTTITLSVVGGYILGNGIEKIANNKIKN